MFWQGGFMFYGGVVVPVGARVLGSDTEQGFITQSVTNYLNLAGAVCLAVWLEHLWQERKRGVSRVDWAGWFVLALSLPALVCVHWQMDQILNSESRSILDPDRFDLCHKLYLGLSTIQWIVSLGLLALTIRRWDRAACSATQAGAD